MVATFYLESTRVLTDSSDCDHEGAPQKTEPRTRLAASPGLRLRVVDRLEEELDADLQVAGVARA